MPGAGGCSHGPGDGDGATCSWGRGRRQQGKPIGGGRHPKRDVRGTMGPLQSTRGTHGPHVG